MSNPIMIPRLLRIAPFILAAAALPGVARAEPTPADQALAAALFDDGRKLLTEGKIDEACTKLGRSYELEAVLGTLLNLAVCHDKQGKTATAWAEFNSAADLADKARDSARKRFALEQVKATGARLSRLTVRAPALPGGASVKLDGRDLGPALLGTAVPLDPGDHRIEVTAPGKRTFAVTVKVDAGPAQRTLDVPPLDDQATAPPVIEPPPANTVSPANTALTPPPVEAGGGRSTPRLAAGIAVGGAGLVGVVVGAVFGVRTFQKKGEIGSNCTDSGDCNSAGVALQEDAHRSATASTVAFAVGLVAVTAGVVLVATSGTSGKPRASAWIAPAPAGFAAGLRF